MENPSGIVAGIGLLLLYTRKWYLVLRKTDLDPAHRG